MNTTNLRNILGQAHWRRRYVAIVGLLLLLGANAATADTFVTGRVNGRWSAADSPIRVVGETYVAQDDTLVITGDVQVWFEGAFALEVSGLLIADGTQNGGWIQLRSNSPWRGVYFTSRADGSSRLVLCQIVNAWIGVQTERADITIEQCRINALSIGVNSINASPRIADNEWIIATSDNTFSADVRGISIVGDSNPIIDHNARIEATALQRGDAFGIWINGATATMEWNWIEAKSNQASAAIYARRADKAILHKNILRTFSTSQIRGVWFQYSSAVQILSNTILLMTSGTNAVGLNIDVGSASVLVTNNIILGNGTSVGDSTGNGRISEESGYNNYYNHSINHVGDWEGGEGEINRDPRFERQGIDFNGNYYKLTENSPCKDAGDPDRVDPEDPWATRSDIGRYPFIYNPNPTRSENEPELPANQLLIRNYPNPFNSTTTITFELALPGRAVVSLFDLNGRHIMSLYDAPASAGETSFIWRAGSHPAGEYLVRLEASGQTLTTRLLFLP